MSLKDNSLKEFLVANIISSVSKNVGKAILGTVKSVRDNFFTQKYEYLKCDYKQDAVQIIFDLALFESVLHGQPGSKIHLQGVGMYFDPPGDSGGLQQAFERAETSRKELGTLLGVTRLALDILTPEPIAYDLIPKEKDLMAKGHSPKQVYFEQITKLYEVNKLGFVFFCTISGLIANQKIYKYEVISTPLSLSHPPEDAELDLISENDDTIKTLEEKNLRNTITLIKRALVGKHKFRELDSIGKIQKDNISDNCINEVAEKCFRLMKKYFTEGQITAEEVEEEIIIPRDSKRREQIIRYISNIKKLICRIK